MKEFALEKHKDCSWITVQINLTYTETQYKNKNNNTEQCSDIQNMLDVTRLTWVELSDADEMNTQRIDKTTTDLDVSTRNAVNTSTVATDQIIF